MKLELFICLVSIGLSVAYPQDEVLAATTEDANENVIEDSTVGVLSTTQKISNEKDTVVDVSTTQKASSNEENTTIGALTTQKASSNEEDTTLRASTTPKAGSSEITKAPTRRYPCSCAEGECGCCTGSVLQNFNISLRQRGCVNITYDPDDFAFNLKLLFNDRVLYQNKMSAKNPRPVCVPINRFLGIKMCLKVSNVFISQRNLHACVELEGQWQEESAFKFPFDCFRIGSNGLAVVKPEDGGGLPPPPDEESESEEEEDYDDSARGWVGSVEVMKA